MQKDYRRPAGFRGLSAARTVFFALLKMLRVILFYVLLWCRVPIALGLQALTSLGAIAFFIMLIVQGWDNAIGQHWPMLAISFGAFILRWIYDGIIMILTPETLFLDF